MNNIIQELKYINQEIDNNKEINIPKSRINITNEEINTNSLINLNYPELNISNEDESKISYFINNDINYNLKSKN